MFSETLWEALFLGVVEGLTEFIPVSSTGHLILLVELLGFVGPPGRVFEVVIQLGAVLALVVLYFTRLARVAWLLPRDPGARHFVGAVLLAFLPAMVIGASLHGFIKSVLFSPWVVCVSLIVGGAIIIGIERRLPTPIHRTIEDLPLGKAFLIGLFQCLAMIPGVSRSGATIMGGLVLRLDRRVATEFSFFLQMPTMLGAVVYDLYKNWGVLDFDDGAVIAVGFVAAFLAALLVVRALLYWISRHTFEPFGWYRIGIGAAMLAVLALR